MRQTPKQHLFGPTDRVVVEVEPFEHAAHQFRLVEFLGLVDNEASATHNPSLAHKKDLDRRFQFIIEHADHVNIGTASEHHLLFLDRLADRGEPVSEVPRPLVGQRVACLVHLRGELGDHLIGIARKEADEFADHPVVGIFVNLTDARARAFLDVVQQTRLAQFLVPPELVVRTGANRKRPQQQVERLANGVRLTVWPEVAVALLASTSDDHRPGPLVHHRQTQERIRLVVGETNVETRLVALDQRELEHQRFDFVGHLDPLNRLGGLNHLAGTGG